MAVTKEKKKELVTQFQKNKKDTGSEEVQVSLLTERINDLSQHLTPNPKDHASRRGLLILVGKRKRLLSYLQKVNKESYRRLIDQLALRS